MDLKSGKVLKNNQLKVRVSQKELRATEKTVEEITESNLGKVVKTREKVTGKMREMKVEEEKEASEGEGDVIVSKMIINLKFYIQNDS